MAKNELLPFADGEDANVLPTNQWEALTDILENGFQSGIAKSEQVNRVLAQGAVASYVLGQLIVDELNQDATLDKDTLYQRLVSALKENAKDACLPLAGGTMTGAIQFPVGNIGFNNNNSLKELVLFADSNNEGVYGAFLSLHRSDCPDAGGAFGLFTRNADNSFGPSLFAKPDGTLTWGGQSLLSKADAKAYVTETWKSGEKWYRKWSDGFIEQGGYIEGLTSGKTYTITLNTAMTTTKYTILSTGARNQETFSYYGQVVGSSQTKTKFKFYTYQTDRLYWCVCGY